jgi:DNA repair photolyase
MVVDPVIAALQEQVTCYQRLAKLAEQQHEHVQQSSTEALLDVLARRQEVLDQVSRLEQTIVVAKRRWGEYVGGLRSEERAQAERLMGETRRLLEEITAADRNDALILQQRKLNLGKQISQASAAKQVNRSYAAAAYGTKVSRMDVRQ